MEYSTLKPWQEIGETGIIHDVDSMYGRFHKISDPRHAKGKRYSLVMLLTVIFLAKLAGKDRPDEIADWAKNNADELTKLLKLKTCRLEPPLLRRCINSWSNQLLHKESISRLSHKAISYIIFLGLIQDVAKQGKIYSKKRCGFLIQA